MFNIIKICDTPIEDKSVKVAIFGEYGIGKTSLLNTIEEPTLCLDFEAGLLSVQNSKHDVLKINSWDEARDLNCILKGADQTSINTYSKQHYEQCCRKYGIDSTYFSKYKCIFIDSITVASRLCLEWAKTRVAQEASQIAQETRRQVRVDQRAVYGKLGEEMVKFLTRMQHLCGTDVVVVGGMSQKEDEKWSLHLEGSKTNSELPGIFDEILVMTELDNERVFVCHTINEFGFQCKDRSGKLDKIEKAHLGALIKKIKVGGVYGE